jgi:hypothetical protein
MPDQGGDLWIAQTVSDLGVAVVIDECHSGHDCYSGSDCYSDHRYPRLPWLAAGEEEHVTLALDFSPGSHRLELRL